MNRKQFLKTILGGIVASQTSVFIADDEQADDEQVCEDVDTGTTRKMLMDAFQADPQSFVDKSSWSLVSRRERSVSEVLNTYNRGR